MKMQQQQAHSAWAAATAGIDPARRQLKSKFCEGQEMSSDEKSMSIEEFRACQVGGSVTVEV